MLSAAVQSAIEESLSSYSGKKISIKGSSPIGGGCINHALKVKTSAGNFFLKTNDAQRFPGMFEAEAKGLDLLRQADVIKVPQVISTETTGNNSFILLEFIERGTGAKNFWENFGENLAALHRHSGEMFGLDHGNYIGSLPQSNKYHEDWLTFFIEERLQKQLEIAIDQRALSEKYLQRFQKLYSVLRDFFPDEPPALLHGDLWSGNFMTAENGEVCIIDPAVYYGHREAELAFTQLFGGFDSKFYAAYQEAFPLQPGFEDRKEVYNLYPLMVHVNLFGTSYLSGVERTLKRFSI